MKLIFFIMGLNIVIFLNGCATSNAVKSDSVEMWQETKQVSKETWHSTKEISKKVWSNSKKVVHNATAE